MPITQARVFNGNVLLGDALGTTVAPGPYFGFGQVNPSPQSTGPRFQSGAGNPNGVLASPLGSLWVDSATGILYRNTNGAMAWTTVGGTGLPSIIYDSGYLAAPSPTMDSGVLVVPAGTVSLAFNLTARIDSLTLYQHILGVINADNADGNYDSVQSIGDPADNVNTAPISRILGSRIIGSAPAAGSSAGLFGFIEGSIPFYDSVAALPLMQAVSTDHRFTGGNTDDQYVAAGSIQWSGAGPVTQIGFEQDGGLGVNFDVGSRLVVYAV